MAGNSEMLFVIEAVAREKDIPNDLLVKALENAMRMVGRRKYGYENGVRASIDRKTGAIKIYSEKLVVEDDYEPEVLEEEEIRDHTKEDVAIIKISDALQIKEDIQVGELLIEQLPPLDFNYVSVQFVKQILLQQVREIESARLHEEFKHKVGKIVSGIIVRHDNPGFMVKVGAAEAMIPNRHLMPQDQKKFKQGSMIKALVLEVSKDGKGPHIVLSRTHKDFLSQLFVQEVPEIYDRIIEIKAVARDPGYRSKIAVYSPDPGVDAVGSCVGIRGSRVQAVINELGGERIDVIQWSMDLATTVINALVPAQVSKVIMDEVNKKIEIVVAAEQLSLAIGRHGQNVKLASELIGWQIDVLTEEAESKRRAEEFSAVTNKFVEALDVEEILGQLLASEGYGSIQDIVDAGVAEIAAIEGLDESIAEELFSRASEYAKTHEDAKIRPSDSLEIIAKSYIKDLPGITDDVIVLLHKNGIKTVYDVADLSMDEFEDYMGKNKLDEEIISGIIMAARQRVYSGRRKQPYNA